MKKVTLLVITLLMSITILTTAQETEMEEVRKYIDAGNATWIKAWVESDASLIANSFDPEGAIFSEGSVVIRGKETIRQRMQTAMDRSGPTVCTIQTSGVWLDGDIAFESGSYTYTFNTNDEKRTIGGKYVVLWRKQADGSWLFYRDLGLAD